jgi:hypothetical protein
LGGELGVYGAVAGRASVPGSWRARDTRESDTGNSCRRKRVSAAFLGLNPCRYIPSLTASVAAPTVPDARTTTPRLEPTFGPVTARSGAPPKNFGLSVSIPYRIAVTG